MRSTVVFLLGVLMSNFARSLSDERAVEDVVAHLETLSA